MYSAEHAAVGTVASVALALSLPLPGGLPALAAVVAYGVALSVFVDLDHFLLARVEAGDWRHLRAALADPFAAFTDQDDVFPDLRLRQERLLSHALLGGALVGGLLVVAPALAAFTAGVLYVHVVCDLLRDTGVA